MQSYSQAGQDLFVFHSLGRPESGTFLELGANDPFYNSNSYALELEGWRGVIVEKERCYQARLMEARKCTVIIFDATMLDYKNLANSYFKSGLDYLSLDVETDTNTTLDLVIQWLRPKIITAEHNLYLPKYEGFMEHQREVLFGCGYDLVCSNVHYEGQDYEDWWVLPQFNSVANKMRCYGKEGKDIVRLL